MKSDNRGRQRGLRDLSVIVSASWNMTVNEWALRDES